MTAPHKNEPAKARPRVSATPDSPKIPHGNEGNTNAVRHGLAAGKLPKGLGYVEKRINKFRRGIEAIILEARGDISLTDASHINAAMKWERHGLLAHHWLRTKQDELSPSDLLRFSEAVAKASDSRNKAIGKLDLDRDVKDNFLESLYARPAITAVADDDDDATDDNEGGDE